MSSQIEAHLLAVALVSSNALNLLPQRRPNPSAGRRLAEGEPDGIGVAHAPGADDLQRRRGSIVKTNVERPCHVLRCVARIVRQHSAADRGENGDFSLSVPLRRHCQFPVASQRRRRRNACKYARCMKNLQIRNVPHDVHRRLKARAAMEGRSLSELALDELMKSLERPTRQELLDRVRARERAVVAEPAADAVRAERDAR